MNSHENARLTALGRAELVRRVIEQGQSAGMVAASFGVCVRTARKWVARFEAEGGAEEEAGVTVGRIRKVAAFYTSPGAVSEHVTAYVGEADLSAAGGVHGLPTEDEDIRAFVLPLDETLAIVENFEANTSPVLITLLWLARHRAALRAEWSA